MVHAQYMASTGAYGHDRTPGRRKKAGENLWRGPRGVFSYDTMIGVMLEEAQHFRPGVFPNISRTGEWTDVAHFTQIVWPTTTCRARSRPCDHDYFVCRTRRPATGRFQLAGAPRIAFEARARWGIRCFPESSRERLLYPAGRTSGRSQSLVARGADERPVARHSKLRYARRWARPGAQSAGE